MNDAYVPVHRSICRRAARLLFQEARILKECHTIAGEWSSDHPVDQQAKKEYDRMIKTAQALDHAARIA